MYMGTQEMSEKQAPDGGGQSQPPASQRARFEQRFACELQRLGKRDVDTLDAWQEENLLSALGAATFGEYELACGLVETAFHPSKNVGRRAAPRDHRRTPLSVGALRRRFERLR
jgi:hypothetical protein